MDLQQLFQGNFDSAYITPTAAGFKLTTGHEVSILAAKSTARYRVMANSFDAIWIVLSLLIEQLEQYFKDSQEDELEIQFEDQLPLPEYFRLIDDHFDHRILISQMRKELDSRAHQFRVVQKRMLTRFKDKTPTPLQKLDTLLSQTYDDVLFLADRLKEANHVLVILESRVAAGSQALLLLMRLKFHLGPDDLEVLQNVFNPRNSRNFEQGWEEALDNALLYLLKTTLTKDPKDMQVSAMTKLTLPADTSKLKKHITQVCEKIHKGFRLVPQMRSGQDE